MLDDYGTAAFGAKQPFDVSQVPTVQKVGRDTVAARNICHLGARYQRFLDDPPPCHPATSAAAAPTRQRPRPASPDDLKAGLKVTRFAKYSASDKTALVRCILNFGCNSSCVRGCMGSRAEGVRAAHSAAGGVLTAIDLGEFCSVKRRCSSLANRLNR